MARKNNLPQLHQLTRVDFTSWHLKLVVALLLAAGTIAAFQGMRTHEFISYDDRDYITINMFDRDGLIAQPPKPWWTNIRWAFTSVDSEGHWIAGNYHPLTWISHEIDISLFGIDKPNVWHTGIPSSGMHHLMDLFFHVVSTVLLFLILTRLTGRPWAAAFVAALFALHPLHIQSVAWASERKDVLSTTFFMLTIMAYIAYTDRAGPVYKFWAGRPVAWLFYLLTFILFGLGLLAKPMLVTLPLILILLDFWPLGRIKFADDLAPDARPKTTAQLTRRERRSRDEDQQPWIFWQLCLSAIEKIPLFILMILDAQQTHFVQGSAGAVVSENMIPFQTRLGNALLAYGHYLRQIVWPVDLSFFYSYRETATPEQMDVWLRDLLLSILVLAAITTLVVYFGRKYRYLPVGWLWYLGMLIPVNGLFVQVGSQSYGDRYTYAPYIGIFFMLALGVGDLRNYLIQRRPEIKRALTVGLAVLAVAAIALSGLYTVHMLHMWQNDESIYTRALFLDPDNAVAHNNWGGMIYQSKARTKADLVNRLNMEAQNLDVAGNQTEAEAKRLEAQGPPADAAKPHAEAAKFHAEAENKRAEAVRVAAEADKLFNEAEGHFARAVELKPGYADALANLGMLTFERHVGENVSFKPVARNPAEARDHALQLHSALTGKEPAGYQKTELCYLIALAVKFDHPGALNNIGNLYRSMSQQAEAEEQKATAEGRTADALQFHKDVLRYRTAAEARYRNAVVAKPDLLEAWANLAVFLEAEYHRQMGEAQSRVAHGQPAGYPAEKAEAAYNETITCYYRAMECDPRSVRIHGQLAMLFFERNRYAEALPQFYAALQSERPPMALISAAWIMATASDDKLRNGKQAVELATQAVQMTKGQYPQALDALAAAYAECGRFDDALRTEQQALGIAQASGMNQAIPMFQQHLQACQNHQPIRTLVTPPPGH